MTETEYLSQISAAFAWIERAAEQWEATHDLEVEATRNGSSVLELEFPSRQKIITNAQAPTQQLWLASSLGAHHFVREQQRWVDTRGAGHFEDVFFQHACQLANTPLAKPGKLD